MALPQSQRLSLRLHRDRLTREGKTVFGRYFTLVGAAPLDPSLSSPRFAVLVSKKTASLATDRNRLKRITSSLIQQISAPLGDYLIIPKRQILLEKQSVLLNDLQRLFH